MKFDYLPITSVATIISGGTPKTSMSEYWNGNIPWLSVKDFNNGSKFVYSTEKHITELGLKNSSTNLLRADDIIISARGTVGEMAMIPFDMAFNQSCFGIRANIEKILPDYLYYALKNNVQTIKSSTHGSVFDTITLKDFKVIKIPVPDLETQKKIVRILSVLDQKIELNNQELGCLTEIGKEVYSDYAKNVKNNIKATDKLEFIKGIEPGSKLYKKEKSDGDVRFIRVGDMLSTTPENYVNKQLCLNSILSESDIAMSFDATIGRVSYGISGGYSSGLRKIKSQDENISNAFIYYWSVSSDTQKVLFENATGTTILHASKAIDYFTLPYDKSINAVSTKLGKLYSKQLQLKGQNNTLTSLRDTLLPKLMSGEIDLGRTTL